MEKAALVGVVEGGGDIAGDGECLAQRQLRLTPEPGPERVPLGQRHGVEEALPFAPRLQQGDDVGVRQRGGDRDLSLKPVGADERGDIRTEKLDGDVTPQAAIEGAVDSSLTPGTKLRLEQISVA